MFPFLKTRGQDSGSDSIAVEAFSKCSFTSISRKLRGNREDKMGSGYLGDAAERSSRPGQSHIWKSFPKAPEKPQR